MMRKVSYKLSIFATLLPLPRPNTEPSTVPAIAPIKVPVPLSFITIGRIDSIKPL